MKYDSAQHHRRSIRLKGYDYSRAGLYFVTICTEGRRCLFGEIQNGEMVLNDAGEMVAQQWQDSPRRFETVKIGEFVVMPNHFHGIVEIQHNPPTVFHHPGQPIGGAPMVGGIVGTFKSLTTNQYIQKVETRNWPRFEKRLWQRNFFEHVIRDEDSYLQIAEYVQTNPKKWPEDRYFAPGK